MTPGAKKVGSADPAAGTDRIWLIGMMGSGKTTIGSDLAAVLDVPFVDTDDVVVSAHPHHTSVAEVWHAEGEPSFRQLEMTAVETVARRPGPLVVATGGGVVLREENVATMRATGRIVWLTAPPEVLATRIGDGISRPLLALEPTTLRLAEVLEERASRYESAADVIIDTGTTTVGEIVTRLEAQWRSM